MKRNWRASWCGWKRRVKKLAWNSTFRKLRSWQPVPFSSVQFSSVAQSCPTLFHPMNRSTSWQIKGGKVEVVTYFLFLGSQTTADGDCSHEIKRCLLLGRKAMTNLDNMLKSRDITLPTKVHIVKAKIFPVVMYRSESRTVKKTCQRIDAFELCAGEDFWESLGLQGDQTSQS